MSYDLTIKADKTYSRMTPRAELASFISQLPGIKPNGNGFVLEEEDRLWMEIDLEVADEEGNNIEEEGKTYNEINCIRLHIPYAFMNDTYERDYLPTVLAIAEHLGWMLCDEQSGKEMTREGLLPKGKKVQRPWWKFW